MKFIDLNKQYELIKDNIKNSIDEVLRHGQFIMGPEVFELENKLSKFVNSRFCLSCSSGTDALLIALMAKNVGPKDSIITTPFTYIATAEVIRLLGAKPVFVDIDSRTFNIDPKKIEIALNNKNIKGIIPVNLFGLTAEYESINQIARKNDVFILEDAAQSFGALYKGEVSGSLGDISATSFFPAKPLGCYGDGGAIFTNNQELYGIMESIRIHGQGIDKYDCDRIGLNGRLDTIQATVLLSKLNIYDQEIKLRQEVAQSYSDRLKNYIDIPLIPDNCTSVWAQYSILLENNSSRLKVVNALKNKAIPSMIYYKKPLHLQKAFSDLGYKEGDFPVSEDISNRILSLPMHPYLTQKQIDLICDTLLSVI